MIRALMIDVDGVLVTGRPPDGDHWAASLEADLGLPFALLEDCFFKPHWDDVVTGKVGLRERLAGVLPGVAPGLAADRLLAYWFERDARLNDELLRDLASLRREGLPVYLATNQEHERARYLLETLGLASHVDGCHYSAAVGHRKPAAGFFAAVVAKVGLPGSDLLLIDDSAENVRAAIAAGWHAVQWTGRERLREIAAGVRARAKALQRGAGRRTLCSSIATPTGGAGE